MHGLELIDRLRQLNPEIQVGVITGWSSPDAETTLREHGIELYFVKPLDTDRLLAAI
jgi:DNA-binding response OmpR family regulator